MLVSGLPPPTFVTVVVVLVTSLLAVVVILMFPSGLGVSVTVTEGPVVTVFTSRGGERERVGPSERSSKRCGKEPFPGTRPRRLAMVAEASAEELITFYDGCGQRWT